MDKNREKNMDKNRAKNMVNFGFNRVIFCSTFFKS